MCDIVLPFFIAGKSVAKLVLFRELSCSSCFLVQFSNVTVLQMKLYLVVLNGFKVFLLHYAKTVIIQSSH